MNNQITIRTSSGETFAFLQPGFYSTNYISKSFHYHNYAEIHVFSGGNAEFHIDNKKFCTTDGNLLIIPSRTCHACTKADSNLLHSAFQVKLDIKEFSYINLPQDMINQFFKEIQKCVYTGNHNVISSYLTLFCSYFDNSEILPVTVTDYKFLIHEFFLNNYSENIQLSELARILHLSERQTNRLVIQHMGSNFRETVSNMRIYMANKLHNTTDIPLLEISRRVGYHSYAGFWKALKKYRGKAKK